MSRQTRTSVSLLLCALVVLSGCHPLQPFYFDDDRDLSHYLDKATDLEYPDVCEASLAEVTNAEKPFTVKDPEPREIWDLSLEEAVSIAMQNSKVLRGAGLVIDQGFSMSNASRVQGASTIYDPAILESDTQNGVEAALSEFDAQLSMLGSNNGSIFSNTDRPNLNDSFTNPLDDNEILSLNQRVVGGVLTELSKRTATGTRFSVRNQTNYTRGDNQINRALPVHSVWETWFEVEARQPLMRGRGAQVNRIPVLLARTNVDISLAQFEASVRNFVLDIENAYWDLCRAYRFLETAKIGRDSAQVTWKSVYEKFQGGIADVQAEAQSREQYFFFRGNLEQTLNELYETENRLRLLMGIAASDGRLIRPIDEPTTARVEFDWRAIHNEAIGRSPELRELKWAIKNRELRLILARNQLLPQLDIGAMYRWYGVGDHLINADRNGQNFIEEQTINGSTAFDELTEGNFQEASFFFSFQMPVGYRRELAGVRNAQLALARERARLEDAELITSHQLAKAVRNLDFFYQNAQTHFSRWKAAVREVQSVEELYRGGKIELFQVLDSQRKRSESQREYYRAIADYNKWLAGVHFFKGSLLEYNNICLAEGPWPEKAYWDALDRARERDASYYMNYGWTRPRVVSQGPVVQHTRESVQVSDQPIPESSPESIEAIPAPQPTPAQPERELAPERAGPITELPDGPSLNAPRLLRNDADSPAKSLSANVKGDLQPASSAGSRAERSFDWGNLGLTTTPSAPVAVRQAAHAH